MPFNKADGCSLHPVFSLYNLYIHCLNDNDKSVGDQIFNIATHHK